MWDGLKKICSVNNRALHSADHITVYKVEEQRANMLQAQHQEPVCYPLQNLEYSTTAATTGTS